MNKKRAIKVLSATAVAATAFVATSPAQAASTNDAASLVKKAKDAGTVLKWAISTEGSADGTTRPWAQYNAAKDARDKAVAAVNKLPAAQKAAYLADIEQNVTLHINRAMAYIDAITAGEKINVKKEALEALIAKNVIDDQTEAAYHELSKEIRKQGVLLDRVYGKSTRDEIRKAYKQSAEAVRDSIKYEVTVKIELDLAKEALAANNQVEAEKHLAEAAKYMAEVKNEVMKEALTKTLEEVEAQMTFKVASVSAITTTTVDVTITAPKEDVLGATVEVKDSKGNVVEVNPVDISAGDTVVSFTFKNAVTAEDLTGVWTVDGKEYNFDAIKQLQDITDAASASTLNEVELLEALNAAGIKNVNEDALSDYATAIKDASPETLADVQKAIDEVNKAADEANSAAAKVKAVVDATNQVQLLKALQANFDRVNADWNGSYAAIELVLDTNLVDLTAENSVGITPEEIQAAIDEVNAEQVDAAYDKAFKSLKSADVTAARTLVNTYIADAKEGEEDHKAFANDSLDVLDALIKVDAATTNNSLKKALTDLDALESKLVEKYNDPSVIANDFDLTTVVDANLGAYLVAIDKAEVGAKNQRSDIQTIITNVNDEAAVNVIKEVNNADSADKLLAALKKLGLTDVVDANKAAYYGDTNNFASADKDAAQQLVKDINAAEAFKVTYKTALALKSETVKVADLPTLREAVNEYDKLTPEAQAFTGGAALTNLYASVQGSFVVDVNLINGNGNMSEKLELLGNKYYANLTADQKHDVAMVLISQRPVDGFVAIDDKTAFEVIETELTEAISTFKTSILAINNAKTVAEMEAALTGTGLISETGAELTLLADLVLSERPEAGYVSFTEILAVIK